MSELLQELQHKEKKVSPWREEGRGQERQEGCRGEEQEEQGREEGQGGREQRGQREGGSSSGGRNIWNQNSLVDHIIFRYSTSWNACMSVKSGNQG